MTLLLITPYVNFRFLKLNSIAAKQPLLQRSNSVTELSWFL